MNYLTFVNTSVDGRRRFYSESINDVLSELRRHYPIGQQVEQRLRQGQTIETGHYQIRIVKLVSPTVPKRQRKLKL